MFLILTQHLNGLTAQSVRGGHPFGDEQLSKYLQNNTRILETGKADDKGDEFSEEEDVKQPKQRKLEKINSQEKCV